jgi:hypothetical protein
MKIITDFVTDYLPHILVTVLILVVLLAFYGAVYEQNNCIRWETEKQFQAPMYMQPGKDGGVSIPLSNGKWVDVKVCKELKGETP